MLDLIRGATSSHDDDWVLVVACPARDRTIVDSFFLLNPNWIFSDKNLCSTLSGGRRTITLINLQYIRLVYYVLWIEINIYCSSHSLWILRGYWIVIRNVQYVVILFNYSFDRFYREISPLTPPPLLFWTTLHVILSFFCQLSFIPT